MKNTNKIRWGIIGLGNIASQFASDLQLIDDAELTGVASRNNDKANEFAKNTIVKNLMALMMLFL